MPHLFCQEKDIGQQPPSHRFPFSHWCEELLCSSSLSSLLRNGVFPAISVKKKKKKMSLSSAIAALLPELVSPEETQDVKTEYWPQLAEVPIKGRISVSPDSCMFPDIEKY